MLPERKNSNTQEVQLKASETLERIKAIQAAGDLRTIALQESFTFGGSDEVWWGQFIPDIRDHHDRVMTLDIKDVKGSTVMQRDEKVTLIKKELFKLLEVRKKGPNRYLSYDPDEMRDGYRQFEIYNVWRTNLAGVYWHEMEIAYFGGIPRFAAITINEDFRRDVNNPLVETIWHKIHRRD